MGKKKTYDYAGREITKQTVRDIFDIYWPHIALIKKAKSISRQQIIHAIHDFHVENGGLEKDATGNITKILLEFERNSPNRIKRERAKGWWYLNLANKTTKKETPVKSVKEKKEDKTKNLPIKANKTFGKGQFNVYVFYCKQQAVCKIGKTVNLFNRWKQLISAIPEPWTLPYLIKFETKVGMDQYEKTLHGLLTGAGLHKNNKGKMAGSEFFNINPKKLSPILSKVNNTLKIK